jgi:predicted Zn-dependent peptidase
MQVVDSQQAVKIAADVLKNPEAKRSAFEIAVEVAVPDRVLTEEKKVILENIAAKLYINREFMQQAMEKFAS